MTKTNKIIASIIGLIAVVVVGYGVYSLSNKSPAVAGADVVEQYPSYWVNGINIGGRYVQEVKLTMGEGQNQASWKNNTGKIVNVRDLVANLVPNAKLTTPVASTSMNFFVGTSTTATVTDSATPVTGTLIDTYVIATSTGTGTAINSMKDGGTAGREVIPVLPGQYLIAVMEQTNSGGEAATSTNRGFNLTTGFQFTYLNN